VNPRTFELQSGKVGVKVTTVIYDINTVTGLNTFSVPTRYQLSV